MFLAGFEMLHGKVMYKETRDALVIAIFASVIPFLKDILFLDGWDFQLLFLQLLESA